MAAANSIQRKTMRLTLSNHIYSRSYSNHRSNYTQEINTHPALPQCLRCLDVGENLDARPLLQQCHLLWLTVAFLEAVCTHGNVWKPPSDGHVVLSMGKEEVWPCELPVVRVHPNHPVLVDPPVLASSFMEYPHLYQHRSSKVN